MEQPAIEVSGLMKTFGRHTAVEQPSFAAPAGRVTPSTEPRWRRLLAPPSPAGLLGAAVAFAASLTPGLYPRHWLVQGALSGVALAVGYGLGAAIASLARSARAEGTRTPRYRTAGALGAGIALGALLWNGTWQVDVRDLMGLDQGVAPYAIALTAAALVAGVLLLLLGRTVRAAHRGYVRLLRRVVPHRWLRAVRVAIVILLLVPVLNGLLLGWTMGALDAALVAGDARIDPAVAQPSTTYRAGGPESLIPWDTLSAPGRAFVAQGPTVAELEAFSGEPATPPIRVYVGMPTAPTDRERARLAVAELDRMGAFGRSVLIVVTPTGSGSINPYAIDSLEYMHAGDTAAVAMQYGHLPSWVTMAGNQERAQRGATALFDAVTQRLREQPAGSRPKLLVYGESLGSFGSEANFADLEDVRASIDGMLLVGPTRGNLLWRDLTANRDRGSPVWRPVYGGGELVRFGWDGASLMEPGGDWRFPRVAYVQHPTDPITWHNPGILLERPEWLDAPRGPDISDRMPYLPILTGLQLTVDMALADTAPLGHGHIYGPEQAEVWALIAPPADWTPQQTRNLVALLAAR